MRDKSHYLEIFTRTETVGAQLLARAIYAARYFDPAEPDRIDPSIVGKIMEAINADQVSGDDAVAMLKDEQHWTTGLDCEPVLPWALDYALRRIAYGLNTGSNTTGQTWLAEQVGVNPRTVRRWVSGESPLSGPSAKLARMVIREQL